MPRDRLSLPDSSRAALHPLGHGGHHGRSVMGSPFDKIEPCRRAAFFDLPLQPFQPHDPVRRLVVDAPDIHRVAGMLGDFPGFGVCRSDNQMNRDGLHRLVVETDAETLLKSSNAGRPGDSGIRQRDVAGRATDSAARRCGCR